VSVVLQPVLKRRVYRLLHKHAPELLLVHYRECPEDERVEKHSLIPLLFDLYHTLYTSHTKQRAALESQTQQHLPQYQYQQQMSPYPSFSTFQQDYSNVKSDMGPNPTTNNMTMQGLPPHPQLQSQAMYHSAPGLAESFSNGSQTTAPTHSLDDFDTFDPEVSTPHVFLAPHLLHILGHASPNSFVLYFTNSKTKHVYRR